MKLPEWMTARYEDGQIKGCTYGSLEYWHEKGHELLKNNEVWSITKIWGEACAMSAFFGFAYSWGDGGIIFAKDRIGHLGDDICGGGSRSNCLFDKTKVGDAA